MSIKDYLEKIKVEWGNKVTANQLVIFIVLIVLLSNSLAFGLGRLSKIEALRQPVKINMANTVEEAVTDSVATSPSGKISNSNIVSVNNKASQIVASKKGSKYHYLWCSGAKTIKEENKVFFNSEDEAEARGYTKAANCQGP